jgi:hypothetical protein
MPKTGVKPNTIVRNLVISWGWPKDYAVRTEDGESVILFGHQSCHATDLGWVILAGSKLKFQFEIYYDKTVFRSFDITTEKGFDQAKRYFIKKAIEFVSFHRHKLRTAVPYRRKAIHDYDEALVSLERAKEKT